MPLWIAKRSAAAAWKRVPWSMVWAVSVWLVKKGRERVNANLTKKERSELVNLVTKSRGRPGNLAQRDKTRLKNIAGKAIRG
jgi:hypothetical protein